MKTYSIASILRTGCSRKIAHVLFGVLMVSAIAPALADPALVFTKDPDGATIAPGGTATFTYTIKNTGGTTADSPQLVDPLPINAGIVWTTPNADCSIDPPGQTLNCDFPALAPSAQL